VLQLIYTVLDGQRSFFAAQFTLAQAWGNEYQSLVDLYRALGGGWQEAGPWRAAL
jgi:multidrug efflux system outer membrane protein